MDRIRWIKPALFGACLLPLANLAWLAWRDALGANPIETITRSTGTWTLTFLLITLSVTPLRRLSGWHAFVRLRRLLGLYAFFYGCLHFTTYIWLDQFFDPAAIWKDVLKRPFITAGFTSFVLMLPLALTSPHAMMRRLGGRRWQLLHRLVYVVAAGGVLHYLWLVKKDASVPLAYGVALSLLLGYRALHALRARRPAWPAIRQGVLARPGAGGGQ